MLDGVYVPYDRKCTKERFLMTIEGAKSTVEAATRLGCSVNTIRNRLVAYGVTPAWKKPKRPCITVEKEVLIRLLEEHGDFKHAAEAIGSVPPRLRSLARLYGLPPTESQLRGYRGFTTTEAMAREALAQHPSIEKAARSIGVSKKAFRRVMKRWKIELNVCKTATNVQIKEALRNHYTFPAAARSIGIHPQTIRRAANILGVAPVKLRINQFRYQQARSLL